MNESAMLRSQLAETRNALEQAQAAGLEHEVRLHSAKLQGLADRAGELGVDVSEWIPMQ